MQILLLHTLQAKLERTLTWMPPVNLMKLVVSSKDVFFFLNLIAMIYFYFYPVRCDHSQFPWSQQNWLYLVLLLYCCYLSSFSSIVTLCLYSADMSSLSFVELTALYANKAKPPSALSDCGPSGGAQLPGSTLSAKISKLFETRT